MAADDVPPTARPSRDRTCSARTCRARSRPPWRLSTAPDRTRPFPGAPAVEARRGCVTEVCDLTGQSWPASSAAASCHRRRAAESSLARRVDAVDGDVKAILTPTPEVARERAEAVDDHATTGATQSPVAGIPIASEGRAGDERHPHDVRLEDPRELHPAVRLHAVDAPVRRRLGAGGQDELRRVRDGIVERELRVRPGPQPVGSGHGSRAAPAAGPPPPWRPARRCGRWGPTPEAGAAARVALRRGGPEADLRRRLPVRADRVRLVAGHRRDVHPRRARRRHAVGNHRRPRPSGRHEPGRSGARLRARHR